ncbi:MAG: hypothetical protein M1833_004563 [Piccolia ochrophora]|nr:MAG: hypothetical protein M1833_004563 [Piccolia ochrophora]
MLIRRSTLIFVVPITFVLLFLTSLKTGAHSRVTNSLKPLGEKLGDKAGKLWGKVEEEKEKEKEDDPLPKHPVYKNRPELKPSEIVDNFPLAVKAQSPKDLPPIPSWNKPPRKHVPEKTPLYIGFTRNWRLLQLTVVSYITAGWPPEDIYVVENTGTMDSNKMGRLTLQNPFYLDYNRLTKVFGVNVLTTPTLLSFAQLQNFFLYEAIKNNCKAFFWGHMDVAAVSKEDKEPYKSLYMLSVDELRTSLAPGFARDDKGREGRWAIRFFAYDRLALVNTAAFVEVGAWDSFIPYYHTDCDMHERLSMAGFKQSNAFSGLVYDLATSLDDLLVLYRRKPGEDTSKPAKMAEDDFNSKHWLDMVHKLDAMQVEKLKEGPRNRWQVTQTGGQGEPFYRDPQGFELSILLTIDHGRAMFAEKWGHHDCNLREVGLRPDDAWKVEHDWDRPKEEKKKKKKKKGWFGRS